MEQDWDLKQEMEPGLEFEPKQGLEWGQESGSNWEGGWGWE